MANPLLSIAEDSRKGWGKNQLDERKSFERQLADEKKKLAAEIAKYERQLEKENIDFEKNESIKVEQVINTLKKQRELEFQKARYELIKQKEENILAIREQLEYKYKKGLEKEDLKTQIKLKEEEKKLQQKLQKEIDKAEKAHKLDTLTEAHKAHLKLIEEEENTRKEYYQNALADPGTQVKEKLRALGMALADGAKEGFNNFINKVANIGDAIAGDMNNVISKYAQYSQDINTRLQGRATSATNFDTFKGIEGYYSRTVGASGLVRTETLLDNLSELVQSGIAFNVEQRAFLETISDEIAQTFDATRTSLLRIVKLQQADSTASRLGLEAYLTRYLNAQFQDTQYLNSLYDTVEDALVESISQMSTQQGVEFEATVQKWLGSLSSVGMSESTITELATALGYLGSGNVEALSGSSMQNLLVMGANKAGLSYGSLLTNGLTAETTNQLLGAIVTYIKEISDTTITNKVVASEFSQAFGVSISDLTAVSNISNQLLSDILKETESFNETIGELQYQTTQISGRLTTEGILENLFSNVMFSLGSNIASNPALYGLWKITSAIEDLTGGINLPTISVMGNSVDLETTVTNLMRTGIVGISTLGAIGDIINGLQSTFDPASMLAKMDITSLQQLTTGGGLNMRTSGLTTSASTYVGNASSSDIYASTMAGVKEQQQSLAAEAAAEAETQPAEIIQDYLLNTFDPKINALLAIVGKSHGYSLSTVGVNGTSAHSVALSNVLFGDAEVSIAAPSNNTESIETRIQRIENYTRSIYELLSQVAVGSRTLSVTFDRSLFSGLGV